MQSNMITREKDKPKGKKVLLFSGGMDSLIMNFLEKPDILLVLPHNNRYQKKELESINNLANQNYINKHNIIYDYSLDLGKFERDDAIIPSRNLLFITIAANYGEEIMLGSVYGDRSLDKSIEFFKKCEIMFNYLYQDQHWCKERKFKIHAPYKSYTKTELTKLFLSKGGDPNALLVSTSCYENTSKACGWCKPCFRKWVALTNNNIDTTGYFENKPYEAPWLDEILNQIDSPEGYRGREDKDILHALSTVKNKYSKKVK